MVQMIEVAELVYRYDSQETGPIVGIIGGTHGNEITGQKVVQRMKRRIETNDLQIIRGTVLLAFGNPKAIVLGERWANKDLNRAFSDKILAGHGDYYEARRARDLARVLGDVEVGIDIHATNKPSAPFVACQALPTVECLSLCRSLNTRYILADPHMVFAGERVTLDEYLSRDGAIGFAYETGQATDMTRIDEVETEIVNILARLGLTNSSPLSIRHLTQTLYTLTTAIMLTEQGFKWADGIGTHSFQSIARGDTIGYYGQDEPMLAQEDSVIIFPKIRDLWEVGKPLGYLAKKI